MKRANKPAIIGSKTVVDFPHFGVSGIPAKVDTGADSSSVWASDIREEDGVLYFRLFDRQSPFFTGKEIAVQAYKTQLVKNSFGQTESRYKVPMSIQLEGRKIKARFTLADRSRNRYPILIGRHTLKHKFLVDVAQEAGEDKKLRVLVMVHTGTMQARKLFAELEQSFLGQLEIDVVRYDELMVVADGTDATITVRTTGRDVASYGFVFFLTRMRDAELAAIVAAYARRHKVGFSDQAAALLATDTKVHQTVLLSSGDIRLPQTVYMDQKQWGTAYKELIQLVGRPFVFKDNNGLKGRNNFLITSKADFVAACKQVEDKNLQMVAQTFIPNDGYYRLVVMGGKVVLAMFRSVDTNKSHTFKKSRDGAAQLVDVADIPGEVQRMALHAAWVLSLEVAGVDILQDNQTGEWYCIEVNNSPQLVGGAFVDEKMQALGTFFIQESKK